MSKPTITDATLNGRSYTATYSNGTVKTASVEKMPNTVKIKLYREGLEEEGRSGGKIVSFFVYVEDKKHDIKRQRPKPRMRGKWHKT